MTEYPHPHDKLDACTVARRARVAAYRFTQSLPRGWSNEARQINDAAASVVRAIEAVVADGPRTPDMGGAATTRDVGRAVEAAVA